MRGIRLDAPRPKPLARDPALSAARAVRRGKLAAWTALAAFARRSDLSALNARVFCPVGRNEAPSRLLPTLLRGTLDGVCTDLGPAELMRDFMDVRDAGEAIARLALCDAGGVVNVGTGQPVGLGELARRVGGRVRLGARPPREGEPLWIVADPGRLRRATGFAPRFTLDATISDALAHWRMAA